LALFAAVLAVGLLSAVSCAKKSGDAADTDKSGREAVSETVSDAAPEAEPEVSVAAKTFDTLIDGRDGKVYKTVKIGGRTWMAENLNIKKGGSRCYGNIKANCDKYGRLYDWETAKTVCPSGWRLPSDRQWYDLTAAAGGSRAAGKKLKSASGWNGGEGTDDYGFSALPGGMWKQNEYDKLVAEGVGGYGYWWGTVDGRDTQGSGIGDLGGNLVWIMGYDNDGVQADHPSWGSLYSVRCVEKLGCAADGACAKCGKEEYDPEKEFCHKYTMWSVAWSVDYNPPPSIDIIDVKKGFIDKSITSYNVIEKCGGMEYLPVTQSCHDGVVKDPFRKECICSVYDYYYYTGGKLNVEKRVWLGSSTYDPETHFCGITHEYQSDEEFDSDDPHGYSVLRKCGGKKYDYFKEFCHNDSIVGYCDYIKTNIGEKYDVEPSPYRVGKYDPAKEFCYNDKMILKKCGGETYNPNKQKCKNGELVNK